MYRLYDHGGFILDEGRTRAYAECLRRCVTDSSVVVDIGAGTGFFALLAAQLGARKVYAIEADDIVQLGMAAAERNGLGGRVQFIQRLSTDVDLPERADVIVSDIHGILPPHLTSLASLIDGRDRFLAPGGRLVPARATLWAALVDAPAMYRNVTGAWGADTYGLDLTPIRAAAVNCWERVRIGADALVTSPMCWSTIDYASVRSRHVRGSAGWDIAEARVAHGICAWFDWEGIDDIGFSNSPLSGERHIYGQAFFPWPDATNLTRGDRACVELRADAVGSQYVYSWSTTIRHADGSERTFQQSDFFGAPLPLERMHRAGGSA
jgi:protein arginine N-methyltransferase 1